MELLDNEMHIKIFYIIFPFFLNVIYIITNTAIKCFRKAIKKYRNYIQITFTYDLSVIFKGINHDIFNSTRNSLQVWNTKL